MGVQIVLSTTRGLEWVAAAEAEGRLAPDDLALGHREVEVGLPRLVPDVLGLRTCDDAFLVCGTVTGVGQTRDALVLMERSVGSIDVAAVLGQLVEIRVVPAQPSFDVVVSALGKRNYGRYEMEDRVGMALGPRLDGTYVSHRNGVLRSSTHLTWRIRLIGEEATISLRLGVHPLHRREYRIESGLGSLHPPVASALSFIANPPEGALLLDPFCGWGTIPIEAGILRPDLRVIGADIDEAVLRGARQNAHRAGVPVDFVLADAGAGHWTGRPVDAVVTNPPWNVTVDARGELRGGLRPALEQFQAACRPGAAVAVIADIDLGASASMTEAGFEARFSCLIRLAGRVCEVLLMHVPGRVVPAAGLDGRLDKWVKEARARGLLWQESVGSGHPGLLEG